MDLFFELLQVAVGTRERLSHVPTAQEWEEIFNLALQQTLVGVIFQGVERLMMNDAGCMVNLPLDLKLEWIGETQIIEEENRVMDKASAEVLRMFAKDGFKGCILKGQGNALMYPNPERRQAGDVDIWLLPMSVKSEERKVKSLLKSRREIIRYVTGKYPEMRVQLHHVDYPLVGDAEVEVHFFPIYLKNPFHHRRLLRFFAEHAQEQFANNVTTRGGEKLTVPTAAFNAVYQMVHVYLHYLFQGVGLRQIVDYCYVLMSDARSKREDVIDTLRSLHMMKFVSAMMWVLKEVCGAPAKWMLCEPDAIEGHRLLDEMMEMGNFGKYSERYWKGEQKGLRFAVQKMRRQTRMAMAYPQEILWDPYFRVRLFLAKRFKV